MGKEEKMAVQKREKRLLYSLSGGSLCQHGSQVDDGQFDNLWLFFAVFD